MKKGFTLLELMVVVGIIGILSAILLKAVSGSSDSARATKCLANMRDLANACHAYALDHGNYPFAGSGEGMSMAMNFGSGTGITKTYGESHGWVSWASMGAYKNSPKASQKSSSWFISTYEGDEKKRLYALTNGAIWKAISGNASSYRCPLHEQYAKKNKSSPVWSYVMNSEFGCDGSDGGCGRSLSGIGNADRLLLFGELPFNTDNKSQTCKYTRTTGLELDPTLQYKNQQEVIGFNHKSKRIWRAHICFADGHTETLSTPVDSSRARLRELTTWLCEGKPITYDGNKYREAK